VSDKRHSVLNNRARAAATCKGAAHSEGN